MASRKANDHDSAAGGLEFDFPFRERATALGQTLAEHGPDKFFEEVEELVPEQVRDQVRSFPLFAVGIGVGIGVFLGMKKGEEILAAGAALVSATAMANVAESLEHSREP